MHKFSLDGIPYNNNSLLEKVWYLLDKGGIIKFTGVAKFLYTKHAITRMLEREITESEILECIENYDVNHTDKKGNFVYRATLSNGRKIKVILQKENPNKVITVGD